MVAKWALDLKDKDFLFAEMPKVKIKGKPILKALKGDLKKHWWNSLSLTPPLQPRIVLIEGDNISFENFFKDWISTFGGTGGFKFEALRISEKFHYSETSQQHGTMLQKITHQRSQAKETLASIQNLKTAIMNIESDLEKMDEQITAFQDGDWEQIKSLFIDNYGGPQRNWNAIARNVPLVRMAMTWFLRLGIKYKDEETMPIKEFSRKKLTELTDKEKAKEIRGDISSLEKKLKAGSKKNKEAMIEEIDGHIKTEQINPAIGNYLKRKVQEFWNWITDYTGWLVRNKNRIQANLIQQKANLKLYMKWAADHIRQAEALEMKPGSIAGAIPEFSFKSSPREIVKMEYLFYPGDNRPDIVERTAPWIPAIITTMIAGTTVDVPKKFTEVAFITVYGYMHEKHIKQIKDAVEGTASDLLGTLKEVGAITEEEMYKIFSEEEIKEMTPSDEDEGGLLDDLKGIGNAITRSFFGLLKIFQIDLENTKEGLPWSIEVRTASIATEMAQRGIQNFKKSHGLIVIE